MKKALLMGLAGAVALGMGMVGSNEAKAQFAFGVSSGGYYGVEDGYEDDGFGWGPAYRRDTTFRPAVGFYGGIERPNPYLASSYGYGGGYYDGYYRRPVVTGGVIPVGGYYGGPVVTRRVVVRRPAYYAAPRVVTRRVVRAPAYYAAPRVVSRRVVVRDGFYAPRRVVRNRVVVRGPAYGNRVVTRRVVRDNGFAGRTVVRTRYY